jgi:hypothetical protein
MRIEDWILLIIILSMRVVISKSVGRPQDSPQCSTISTTIGFPTVRILEVHNNRGTTRTRSCLFGASVCERLGGNGSESKTGKYMNKVTRTEEVGVGTFSLWATHTKPGVRVSVL